MSDTFSWTDIDDIALALAEAHPDRDPLQVRFTELRALVEALDEFEAAPGQRVNEQILEAVQAAWYEESQEASGPGRHGDDDDDDDDEDDDRPRYSPPVAFKPD